MRWLTAGLLIVVGAFMVFDGIRALAIGDYLTPSTGEYAGQLGPWSRLVETAGIPARALGMKIGFVLIGLLNLFAAATLVLSKDSSANWLVVIAAVAVLWYLPFGTVAGLAVLAIVFATTLRP